MTIQPSDSKMPVINPHMKFKVQPIGVVNSPAVYQYSLHDELEIGNNYYKEFLESVNKNKNSQLLKKYPNLKLSLWGVCKLLITLGGAACAFRYRHSLPVIKKFCKTPQTPPPKFFEDLNKIWKSIVKK